MKGPRLIDGCENEEKHMEGGIYFMKGPHD